MPHKRLLLSTAFVVGSSLRGGVRKGLGALPGRDRTLIASTERPRVGDSLDLDEATRVQFPQANRWDYLLSVPAASQIVAVEPHPARDSEISVVIAKKRHAVVYLRDHLPATHRVAKWFWVSRGTVGFGKMERARRQLDQNGISYEGRVLRSLD